MDGLISRAAAIDAVYYKPSYKMAIEVLKEVPAVDATPVVRCRDCKYWKDQSGTPKWLPCCEIQTDGNWYCADGEQKKVTK